MSNKPNILQNEKRRNAIITILILVIFVCAIIILYFAFSKQDEVKKINRMPFIELYGDTNIILDEHSSFVEYGYYAYDLEDGDLTKKVMVQNELDTNKPGIYTLTYIANDSGTQSAAKTRNVIVKSDETKFNFELKGAQIILLRQGNRFTDPGYIAMYGNQNLAETVKIIGEVDGEKEGIYTLYYVLESNREVAVRKRVVIVSGSLNILNLDEKNLDYISNYNIKELKKDFKIIPEHFSSKTMLILAFSLCKNNGSLTDEELGNCLEETFELKDREISHQIYYDLARGNISFKESVLKWNVSLNLLTNQLKNNLESLKNSLRLTIGDENNIYIFVEDNNYIYKYTFLKKEANYLFVSVEVL